MVLLYDNPGQLGNKLFGLGNLIGNAIEHDYSCGSLEFDRYRHLFNQSRRSRSMQFPALVPEAPEKFTSALGNRSFSHRLICKLMRPSGVVSIGGVAVVDIRRSHDPFTKHYLLDSAEFQELQARHRSVYLLGYFFRDIPHLFDHRERIIDFLQPAAHLLSDLDEYWKDIRKPGHTLVGVHIRRGDYREYLGGKFYYEDEVYLRWMMQLKESISGPVQFLVASTDPIDPSTFARLDLTLAPGNIIGDMYALSRCDLIMGPPSSFSGWASFQKLAPLLHIRDREMIIDLSMFKPINPVVAP